MMSDLVCCCFCGKSIGGVGDSSDGYQTRYHDLCKKEFDVEFKACMDAEYERTQRERKHTKRLTAKLSNRLKPKLRNALVSWINYNEQDIVEMEIVGFEQCSGNEVSPSEFFGERTAIRRVIENVSFDSMFDCYGGDVYIYIGCQQYLKVVVAG